MSINDICYICSDAGRDRSAESANDDTDSAELAGPLLRCGCACGQTTARQCHVSCAARAAQSQGRLWDECSTCKQQWSGQFALRLAHERCRQLQFQTSTDAPACEVG